MSLKWSKNRNGELYPSFNPKKLKPGMYKCYVAPDEDGLLLVKVKPKTEPTLMFRTGSLPRVVKEVERFWASKDRYEELGVAHKRSILLHGPPGCGKTGIIHHIASKDKDGLIFLCDDGADANALMSKLEDSEKGRRRVTIIIEDIEKGLRRYENQLLALLDGVTHPPDGVLFLFTTNYLERVPQRIKGRPSRVDTLIEIKHPQRAGRLEYLKWFTPKNFGMTAKQLEDLADQSKGLSMASLKEVVISMAIYKFKAKDVIQRVKDAQNA